jgi:hypothetical protein
MNILIRFVRENRVRWFYGKRSDNTARRIIESNEFLDITEAVKTIIFSVLTCMSAERYPNGSLRLGVPWVFAKFWIDRVRLQFR